MEGGVLFQKYSGFDRILKINFLAQGSYANNSFTGFIYLNDLDISLKFSLVSSTTGTKILLSLYLWIPEFQYQVVKTRFTNKLARTKLIEIFIADQFQLLYLTLDKRSKQVSSSTTRWGLVVYSKSLCWSLKYSPAPLDFPHSICAYQK